MKITKMKSTRPRRLAGFILSEALLAAALICIVCDLAVFGRFTWSRITMISLLLFWVAALPVLLIPGKKGLLLSFTAFSLAAVPYLYGLSMFLGCTVQMMRIALPISAVGIGFFGGITLIFYRVRNKWNAAALCLLAAAGLNALINMILAALMREPMLDVWDLLSSGILVLLALGVFGAGRFIQR